MGRYCSRVVFLTIGYYRSGVFDQLCYCNVNEITFSIVLIFSIWVSCFAILSVYEDLNMKKNILFYARDKKQLNRLYESHSDSGGVEICRAVSFILFGAFWTQKLNFMVKILESFLFPLKFWSFKASKGWTTNNISWHEMMACQLTFVQPIIGLI